MRMKCDVVMNQFKLNILRLHLSKITEISEIAAGFLTPSKKNLNVGIHSDVY